ncbi:MAG TPA: hypothetical protein VGK87_16410 [Anaerolineae bacterium]
MNPEVQPDLYIGINDAISTSIHWDWRNPLIALPIGTIAVIATGLLVMLATLISS